MDMRDLRGDLCRILTDSRVDAEFSAARPRSIPTDGPGSFRLETEVDSIPGISDGGSQVPHLFPSAG